MTTVTTTPTTTTTTSTTATGSVSSATTPSGSSPRVTIVTHSSITPFAGYVGGRLPQSVETFVSAIEAHLQVKNIGDDKLAYVEARAYLDLTKGDLGEWSRSMVFRCADTWTALKALLRKAYSQEAAEDPILFLRGVARNVQDRRNRSVVRVAADVSDRLVEWADRVRHTNWVKGMDVDGEEYMTLEKVLLLLQLSFVTASLPDRLVSLFDEDLDIDSTELTIVDQIKRQMGKVPDFDPTILASGPVERSRPVVAPVSFNRQYQKNSNSSGHQYKSNNNQSGNKIVCRNCGKLGHIMRFCQVQWCSVHNTDGHKYKECRSRQNSNGNRPTNNANNTQTNKPNHNHRKKHKVANVNQQGKGNFQNNPSTTSPT